jgi:acyl-CoA synthetase (NDP forming)
VDVDLDVLERLLGDAEAVVVRLGVGQRRARRLLHDVAELAGEDELVPAVRALASTNMMSPPMGV